MKFYETASAQKEEILSQLEQAKTADAAARVLDGRLDRLLIAFNDGCDSSRGQEMAASLVGALRTALPLLDTAGEVRVWERLAKDAGNPYREKDKADKTKAALFALAALVCLSLSIGVGMLWETHSLGQIGLIVLMVFAVAGGLLFWLSGRKSVSHKASGSSGKDAKNTEYEVRIDAAKTCRVFLTMLQVLDRQIEEAMANERWEKSQAAREEAILSPEELALYGGLLEAAASNDGEFALERAEGVKHFLHKKGIELVSYSPAERERFDLLPGVERATICPAMVYEGKTIRKGQATEK